MKNLLLLAAFVALLAGPLLLRPRDERPAKNEATLVIVTPHNEATRHEFGRAFGDFYFKKTGRRVAVDWRTPGGTSEISRFLAGQFASAFENEWTRALHRPWNAAVQAAFDNPKSPADDSPAGRARRAFLDSDTGIGIDLFFGGGSFDFEQQAAAGRLVDCGVVRAHPELFNDDAIPQSLGGEPFWDKEGRWIGTALSAFGICYNVDSLARLGISAAPEKWEDLADPRYFGQLALADPTQGSVATKAFEMLIQQQMGLKERRYTLTRALVDKGIARSTGGQSVPPPWTVSDQTGFTFRFNPDDAETSAASFEKTLNDLNWQYALHIIQRIAGNARYFTDSGSKVPSDVELGDAAAGMTIDFYGRFQSEAVRRPDGSSRMRYGTPRGGSSIGVDPIGLLRGAPHPELAREFIEFVLSIEGQKLWNWKTGTPGGPEQYALRRLPIRRELYAPEFALLRSDPVEQPYEQAGAFVYHEEWTGALFRVIQFIVRAMCIDPHDELREAWRALIAAGFPPEATKTFHDVSKVGYEAASGRIRDTLRGPKIDQVKLAKELSDSFREQYRRAAELARAGK